MSETFLLMQNARAYSSLSMSEKISKAWEMSGAGQECLARHIPGYVPKYTEVYVPPGVNSPDLVGTVERNSGASHWQRAGESMKVGLVDPNTAALQARIAELEATLASHGIKGPAAKSMCFDVAAECQKVSDQIEGFLAKSFVGIAAGPNDKCGETLDLRTVSHGPALPQPGVPVKEIKLPFKIFDGSGFVSANGDTFPKEIVDFDPKEPDVEQIRRDFHDFVSRNTAATEITAPECDHERVNTGFAFSYCKKCDAKMRIIEGAWKVVK